MRVLVIDDTAYNQASARATLQGHEVTVATGAEEGYKLIWQNWDVILTDLWMPVTKGEASDVISDDGSVVSKLFGTLYHPEKDRPVDEIPAGLVFALRALLQGVKYVAIVTDSTHHDDRLVALLDLVNMRSGVRALSFEARDGAETYINPATGHSLRWGKELWDLSPDEREGYRPVKNWGHTLETLVEQSND
jgi:CheY-like chemotaxis protein